MRNLRDAIERQARIAPGPAADQVPAGAGRRWCFPSLAAQDGCYPAPAGQDGCFPGPLARAPRARQARTTHMISGDRLKAIG